MFYQRGLHLIFIIIVAAIVILRFAGKVATDSATLTCAVVAALAASLPRDNMMAVMILDDKETEDDEETSLP